VEKKIWVRVFDKKLEYLAKSQDESFDSPVLSIYPLIAQSPESKIIAQKKTVNIEIKTLLLIVDPEGRFQWVDSVNVRFLKEEK